MIALVFTACLWNSIVCKNETIDADFHNNMSCDRQAQFALAMWQNYHPKWNITRYRCGDPSVIDKSIPIR